MRKYFIIFLMILSSCSSNLSKDTNNNINFVDIMDINQFIKELKNYSQNKPYPDIND
tara:strand:- start:208 stop:378 length:171 start_codon:yes stop_codon:yes gene_type:complete